MFPRPDASPIPNPVSIPKKTPPRHLRRHAICATLLSLASLPALAQNSDEPLMLSSTCLGAHRSLPLSSIEGGHLDLNGEITSFAFGDRVTLCIEAQDVVLHDGKATTLPCTEIRDSADQGMGHSFSEAGQSYNLWLHINPDEPAPALEIGLYEGESQLLWIDTGVAICAK